MTETITYVPPVPIELRSAGVFERGVRQAETLATFARHLGPAMAARGDDRVRTARALRRAFDALGSTYVKFGQLIGSSPGAFGQEFADEFRACLDGGPSVPFTSVRRAIEREFGKNLDELFASIDETAIASASIAVVHRATMHDGTVVAVKVLRPGIEQRVALDLDIMQPLFKRLALAGIGPAGPLYRFLSGFRRQVAEELDLRNEARTMTHYRSILAPTGIDAIVIPEVVMPGRRVLVMEFLDGVPIDDLDAIAELGHDPKPLVRDLLRSWFWTGVRDGMFHGDIHAGNLMLLRDGRLGLIDWGIVGILDDDTKRLLRRFMEALLGDETAWVEINDFMQRMAPIPAERRDRIVGEGRRDIAQILTKPFGEVDLTGAMRGPERHMHQGTGTGVLGRLERMRRIRSFRRKVIDSGFVEGTFAQAGFLLFKQLLYFERYGKLYLAEEALLGDREFLMRALGTET